MIFATHRVRLATTRNFEIISQHIASTHIAHNTLLRLPFVFVFLCFFFLKWRLSWSTICNLNDLSYAGTTQPVYLQLTSIRPGWNSSKIGNEPLGPSWFPCATAPRRDARVHIFEKSSLALESPAINPYPVATNLSLRFLRHRIHEREGMWGHPSNPLPGIRLIKLWTQLSECGRRKKEKKKKDILYI
jgi:hypothetical protein